MSVVMSDSEDSKAAWVGTLALTFPVYVTLEKVPDLSVPQSPHL